MNVNEENGNRALATDKPEESGRSKRKRIPRRLADALNGCLCGLVVDSSLSGVLECKQAGCETKWVSTYQSGLGCIF